MIIYTHTKCLIFGHGSQAPDFRPNVTSSRVCIGHSDRLTFIESDNTQLIGSSVVFIDSGFRYRDSDNLPNLNIAAIKLKAPYLSWKFIFAQSMLETDFMYAQSELLSRIADLVDQGKLVTTAN